MFYENAGDDGNRQVLRAGSAICPIPPRPPLESGTNRYETLKSEKERRLDGERERNGPVVPHFSVLLSYVWRPPLSALRVIRSTGYTSRPVRIQPRFEGHRPSGGLDSALPSTTMDSERAKPFLVRALCRGMPDSSDVNYDPDSTGEDGDEPKPVRTNESEQETTDHVNVKGRRLSSGGVLRSSAVRRSRSASRVGPRPGARQCAVCVYPLSAGDGTGALTEDAQERKAHDVRRGDYTERRRCA
ncbi:hypothetical protein AAG570_001850 [Ranatra chinensis]|uniref:Uncharacterized protein n=1 Tax=Ranatra chinensis TaxID=642074 RepID=A0ABD0Y9Q3_9HEMI